MADAPAPTLGRVLVLSASAGAGHVRAAQALERALALAGAATEVRHVDVLQYTTAAFRRVYAKTYLDLVLGYTFPTNTTFRLGVDNLTDEEPPLLYQNNVINANTDVSTYDTIGRAYWASLVQKF